MLWAMQEHIQAGADITRYTQAFAEERKKAAEYLDYFTKEEKNGLLVAYHSSNKEISLHCSCVREWL